METIIVADFSEELRVFLLMKGYTHVWHEGISNEEGNKEDVFETEYYYVSLLENDDERIVSVSDYLMLLDSMDVLEMTVVGADPIKFLIRLPESLYLQYLTN